MGERTGYANPPQHSRWHKGQSGNPSGRPKKAKTVIEDLEAELKETIQINEGGRPKRVTKQRAILKSAVARSIKGDSRATGLLLGLCARMIAADPDQASDVLSPADLKILEDHLEREVKRRQAGASQNIKDTDQ